MGLWTTVPSIATRVLAGMRISRELRDPHPLTFMEQRSVSLAVLFINPNWSRGSLRRGTIACAF